MLGLTSVRTVWHVVRTDGTVVRWASGRDGSIVWMTDREPKSSIFSGSAKSSKSALKSGIPVYSTFTHTSDFVQNEAKRLTGVISPQLRIRLH
jgi:hypothetical protein